MLPNPYLIGGIALAFLLVCGWATFETMRASDAQHQLAAEQQRNSDLAQKVLQADQAVKDAAAVNARQSLALDTQSRAVAALKAAGDAQDAKAREALAKLSQAAQEARQRDAKVWATPSGPTAAEVTAEVREAVGSL